MLMVLFALVLCVVAVSAVAGPAPSPPPECIPQDLPMGGGRGGAAQIKGPADVSFAGVAAWLSSMRAMRCRFFLLGAELRDAASSSGGRGPEVRGSTFVVALSAQLL